MNTVLDLWRASTSVFFGQKEVSDFAKSLADKAGEAWEAVTLAGARADDLAAAYQRGRAHTLCEVLGDQDILASTRAFD